MSRRSKAALFVALLAPFCVSAQETRSMIFGRVLDPQSSVVADAAVTVTNTDTNTSLQLRTNETGYYEANLLLPGNYRVTVEAPGFKKSIRSGISLPISTRTQINVQLELGAVAETVSVSGEAPLLETNAVSSGRIIDNRSLTELPVPRDNPMLLAEYAPGIQAGPFRGPAHYAATITMAQIYSPANVGGNEMLIDGVPNIGENRRVAYMPHTDTVLEFKVETSNFDASIGHGAGASISMMTKAGTNQYHGTLSEQHWQERWNAASFFNKQAYYRRIAEAEAKGDKASADYIRSQPMTPSARSNNYSASIGGPVILPKLYNGKDKLFFFFSFNGTNERKRETGVDINRTIPTLANRQGDFSQLLNVDAVRYQIYDPLSVRADPARPTHFIRDPFPGNIIPASRIVNPAYGAYVKFLPKPNNDPTNPKLEPLVNYLATDTKWNFNYYAVTNRVDYQHSNQHRFFVRWSWADFTEDRRDWLYETAPGLANTDLIRDNVGGAADWVYAMSPSSLLDVALAVNDYRSGRKYLVPKSFKASDVGLPAYVDAKAGDQHSLPRMDFAGYDSLPHNEFSYPTQTRTRTMSAKADFSHVRRSHTLRAGFDSRQYFKTGGGGGQTSGRFSFTNFYTRRNDDTFTPAGGLGHSWAAFMLGLPDALTIDTNDTFATHTPAYAWYVQDNWRPTSKLSLNLGLRLEYEQGMTERYNRMVSYFDRNAKLPISDAAQAAYARNPLPELPASQFVVQGGSLYAGTGGAGRRIWQSELMWLPRLAAAYQLNSKTVLRGGYGLFYDTVSAGYIGPNQFGFSRPTSTNVTNDFGVTWLVGDPRNGVSPLKDPFPVRSDGTRFDMPVRNALGLMAYAGRGFSYRDFNSKHARQQRWRLGIQRQFATSMVLEVAYAGAYSDRVPLGQTLRPLPERYWADGLQRNNAIASDLNSNVANPFRLSNFADLQTSNSVVYQDMSTLGFYTSSIIQKQQLLRAFLQMTGLTNSAAPVGKARSDALEVSFERRFSKGFNLNVGYTRLRAREADFFYNEFDPLPSWRETNEGRPHRFTATSLLELPFGRGRALLKSGILSHVFGGFQLGVMYMYQPGPLLEFGNLFYYGKLEDIRSGPKTFDRWFNTDNFERTSAKAPAAFHRRVFPTRVDGVRAPSMNEWNTNIQREFRFTERVRLQVRLDSFNTMNRSILGGPVTDPLSTAFGKILTQSDAANRYTHLTARIRF